MKDDVIERILLLMKGECFSPDGKDGVFTLSCLYEINMLMDDHAISYDDISDYCLSH